MSPPAQGPSPEPTVVDLGDHQKGGFWGLDSEFAGAFASSLQVALPDGAFPRLMTCIFERAHIATESSGRGAPRH